MAKEGWVTPQEAAKMLGKTNAEKIRAALRAGTFPFGCAYHADGKWTYAIPREPLEEFCRTGRVPPIGERTAGGEGFSFAHLMGGAAEEAQVLRDAAAIYIRMAERLESAVTA